MSQKKQNGFAQKKAVPEQKHNEEAMLEAAHDQVESVGFDLLLLAREDPMSTLANLQRQPDAQVAQQDA